MKSYVDSKSNDNYCCDGTTDTYVCNGKTICTLGSNTTDISSCTAYLQHYNTIMDASYCNINMPYYFEDNSQTPMISGCAAQVNVQRTAPAYNANSCRIYGDKRDQYYGISCENKKMEADAQNSAFCKATNCNVGTGGNGENVIWVNMFYMDQDGSTPIQTACEFKDSIIRHLTLGYGDYYKNDSSMQAKTGTELETALAQVNAGTYPGMCSQVTCDDNQKVYYVIIQTLKDTPIGYLQLSQLVVKNRQGRNIAKNSKTSWASMPWAPANKKELVVDGTEAVRPYPNIYHSKDTQTPWLTIKLNTPTCLSDIASVTIYGRADCCSDRNAGKEIRFHGTGGVLWKSPETTQDNIQTFKVPS
jgi:hypothetical protein